MKRFSEIDQKRLLVIARLALADGDLFDDCGEAFGISNREMQLLSDRVYNVTETDPEMKTAIDKLWDD